MKLNELMNLILVQVLQFDGDASQENIACLSLLGCDLHPPRMRLLHRTPSAFSK